MERLTIGDIARASGVRPSAIRYYERVGILPTPERVSGQRRYHPDVVHLLGAIAVAKQAGFSMAEIRTLFRGVLAGEAPSAVWRELAQRKVDEVDQLITRAQAMKRLLEEGMRCGCLQLEDCALVARTGPPFQDSRHADDPSR